MKMQTVVAAAALALALSARADQWFDARIANIDDWPDTAGWTNTGNTTYTNETISLEGASGLTYTASPTKTLGSSEAVTVTTTMKLTAYDADDLPEVPEDAKAAIIAVNDDSGLSYKGLAKVESANGWVALTGATPREDASVDISISLLDGKVQYKVDNTVLTSGNAEWLDVVASGTVSNVVYKGTGEISALSGMTEAPTATVALVWPTGYTAVSYQVGDGEPVSNIGTSPVEVSNLPIGTVVKFVVQNADGAEKTLTGTAGTDSEINAADATFTWADYLGDADNGAYTIGDANDLDMLRKGVAAGLATTGETFKQTADIDMASAGAFAGIGTYAKIPTAGVPFLGTYDGQNFKISNVTRAGGDTQGIFNQVGPSGVIENLVVENMTAASGITGYGFAIVGNAGGGATLRNLTAAGTFASASNPSGHNIAGIVVRLSPGATAGEATTIDSCTNNATIYGGYTKLGGINAIVQNQTGFKDGKVVFVNCANTGTLVCKRTANDVTGNAGIVGYIAGTNVELTGCYGNGVITNTDGANTDKDGALVGWTNSGTIKDNGGNSAPSDKKMIGTWGNATETGFLYATVADGVATTVDGALAAGNTYLLEGNVAASETPVATLTTVGDTIAFDTALGYTFAGTVAGSGAAGIPVASTSGKVTTYTAGYFPRTATAGQDGSAEHPFEIADEDDLQALQACVTTTNCTGLSFVQTADIALTAAWPGIGPDAGKDLAANVYEAGAFAGIYDGGNYTISNFSMVDGVDYGGLFNSINNATIKNLKISWGSSKLCSNSSSSGDDTGASFVGTAKGSTLQNLTALAGTVTVVTASKDMAGIVGYVYGGSTVDSCTNELNITSFKSSRKCGGIAVITQNGSGNAIFRNCYNSGTVTTPGTTYREGGIVGYINVATTIDGCENTANVKLFHVEGSPTVTVTGTNKGYAGVISNDKGVSGLNFATVDGTVATFVADNALALNGSYKVMATGATATFAFAEAGTIAFDTNLTQNVTFAITAPGLNLSEATADGVVTFTAAAPGYNGGGDSTFTIPANREAALEGNLPTGKTLADKVSATSDLTYAQAYALGLWSENSAEVADLGATITVGADGKVSVSLATEPTTGYLVTCKVYEKASLTAEWPTEPKATYAYGSEQEFTPASSEAGFYKVEVVITNAQ